MADWKDEVRAEASSKKAKYRSKTLPLKLTQENQEIVFCSEPVPVWGHYQQGGGKGKEFRKCGGDRCQLCLDCKADAKAAGDEDWRDATDRELRLYILLRLDGREYYKDFVARLHGPFFMKHEPVSNLKVEIKKNGEFKQSRIVMRHIGRENVECRDAEPFILSHRFCNPPNLLTEAQMERALNDLTMYGATSLATPKKSKTKAKDKAPASNGHHKNGHLAGVTE